jgi:DNA methyltransferase 1-associated protein 1
MGVEGVHIFRAARLPARSWTWRGFTSSARHDSAEFHHWVRANVEYADYPYARFDVSLNPLVYTDEEYARYFETTDVSELMGGSGIWSRIASGVAGSASTAEQGSSTAESAAAPASSTAKAESAYLEFG